MSDVGIFLKRGQGASKGLSLVILLLTLLPLLSMAISYDPYTTTHIAGKGPVLAAKNNTLTFLALFPFSGRVWDDGYGMRQGLEVMKV